jgi:hypothetical protein
MHPLDGLEAELLGDRLGESLESALLEWFRAEAIPVTERAVALGYSKSVLLGTVISVMHMAGDHFERLAATYVGGEDDVSLPDEVQEHLLR